MSKPLSSVQASFVTLLNNAGFASGEDITRSAILKVADDNGLGKPWWLIRARNNPHRTGERGTFLVPSASGATAAPVAAKAASVETDTEALAESPAMKLITESADKNKTEGTATTGHQKSQRLPDDVSMVPARCDWYVRWGNSKKVEKIVKSKKFFPIFVTGLSGNGKTFMIEQACAAEKREFFRVNITSITEEDDLLGGFRLIDGDMVFVYGPVLEAMMRGGVLLLDEIDLGTEKMMCLQPVLEGKPVFVKKINQWVYPAPGFQVFATANTKGQGDDTDMFIGTNQMNEAMLERFPVTLEQPYPNMKIETKILKKVYSAHGQEANMDFIDIITKWADQIREGFKADAHDAMITTRRAVMAIEHDIILDEGPLNAIKDIVTRFDETTKTAFVEMFEKLTPDPEAEALEAKLTAEREKKAAEKTEANEEYVGW